VIDTDSHNRLYHNISSGSGGREFLDVTIEAGLEARQGNCGVFLDYDNDGWLDIYVVCLNSTNRLYRNEGNGTFILFTSEAGVEGRTASDAGVATGDYNNDCFVDIYLTYLGFDDNILYHNDGDGTFTDVTISAGVGAGYKAGVSSVFGDYNNDGHLDIYVSKGAGFSSILYRNNGNGTFSDKSGEAGVDYPGPLFTKSCLFADYNNDGFLDIYITGDGFPNILFENERNGTFSDISVQAGVEHEVKAKSEITNFGAAFGDYNRDGQLDLFATGNPQSFLYENNGNNNHFLVVKLQVYWFSVKWNFVVSE